MIKVFCSCNGKECDGICRETHLYKKGKRQEAKQRQEAERRCGAAYSVDESGKEIGQLTVTEAFEAISKKGK